MKKEEIEKIYNDLEPMLSHIDKVAATLSAGDCKETSCPKCNGKLFISRSSYNGHVHAKCEGCGFVAME